jgi:DNA modification methylase
VGEAEGVSVRILQGDCGDVLKTLPDESVNCIVTSPPYWRQRDYGVAGQLGLETTPEEYIDKLVAIFAECRRVLRMDGTCWVNLGDKWASGGNSGGGSFMEERAEAWAHVKQNKGWRSPPTGYKDKDLVGLPWMFAFAARAGFARCDGCDMELRGDLWPVWNGHRVCVACERAGKQGTHVIQSQEGWYLRQCNIWAKPNCMPESVMDRSTAAHEYVFQLTKNNDYWYDAEAARTPAAPSSETRLAQNVDAQAGSLRANAGGKTNGPMKAVARTDKQRGHTRKHAGFNDRWDAMPVAEQCAMGANLRSVWWISPAQYREGHYAVMPAALAEICIAAGCPDGGTVLDPFGGAGTTGLVADRLGRDAILIELNPMYADMARKRIVGDAPLFAEVA